MQLRLQANIVRTQILEVEHCRTYNDCTTIEKCKLCIQSRMLQKNVQLHSYDFISVFSFRSPFIVCVRDDSDTFLLLFIKMNPFCVQNLHCKSLAA